jgi:hypothetical protein
VVDLVRAQDLPQMGLVPGEGAGPIQRSAIAFIRGARTLQGTVRIPASLSGDVAAALREHGSATLDEHCYYFRRSD